MKRVSHSKPTQFGTSALCLVSVMALGVSGCASVRSFLVLDSYKGPNVGPIRDPFTLALRKDSSQTMVFRTKKGDRAVELEIPGSSSQVTDVTIPVGAAFRDDSSSRGPASVSGASATASPGSGPAFDDPDAPELHPAYEKGLEQVRRLFHSARFEVALMETDSLLKLFPTAPKLHQMRGTLLDRVGQFDLALKSWRQALTYEPTNESLRKFVHRREQGRSLASP